VVSVACRENRLTLSGDQFHPSTTVLFSQKCLPCRGGRSREPFGSAQNSERIAGLIPGERQNTSSFRQVAGAVLLLMFTLLPGCSDLALPSEDMPASGPDPRYNNLVADYLKNTFKNRASYDAFAISAFRWVHSFNGWAWLTCVRFEDNGHPRAYAVFIKDGKIIDSRYAVQTDACNTQTYAVLGAMGSTRAGILGPLY
jgi:hypothetical protein